MKRPARPPAELSKGRIFAAAALEVDVVVADPVVEELEGFGPVAGSSNISSCLFNMAQAFQKRIREVAGIKFNIKVLSPIQG
jgi:hypothetical protein